MAIERTRQKLKIHKNVIVKCLLLHPEDLRQISPTWDGTVEELIAELRADPREWIVSGELAEVGD